MSWNQIEGKWREFVGAAKQRWAKYQVPGARCQVPGASYQVGY